jgi:hypothetical protein
MLDRRLHVLLDEERYRRLEARARERGVSVARVVREAIDAAFPGEVERKKRAAKAILEADPMPVPEPEELRRELDEIRYRRV